MGKSGYGPLLRRGGFSSFLATQFLGALNDNLLKWCIVFLTMAGMVRGASARESANLDAISNLFILPSLLFAGWAGWFADNFSKRRVLITTKAFEMGVMLLAWAALRAAWFPLQLAVLFLLATQFTFFGPSKYGVLPELVPDADLGRANGLVEMSTFVAILLGSALAGPLFKRFKADLDGMAAILFAVAALGSLASLGIGATPEPKERRPFRPSLLWSEIAAGTRRLYADPRMWTANLGTAYFWFQGVLFQLAVVLLGKQVLHFDESGIAGLGVALALGVGLGSLLAGRLGGGKAGLDLAPWGVLGMGVAGVVLGAFSAGHPWLAYGALAGVGAAGGVLVVPLNALLQREAGPAEKGRVLAANNFMGTLAMIAAALLLDLLSGRLGLAPDRIVLLAGLASFVVAAGFWLRRARG